MFRINLTEIPEQGRDWTINRQSGELTEVLKDLIQDSNYLAEFSLRPLGNGSFDLQGQIRTSLPEDCSRCGLDFLWPVNEKFRELLLPGFDQPRNAKSSRPNHLSDLNNEGPSVQEYHGHHFDMGEYLHEVVAISLPSVPAPPETPEGKCSTCDRLVRGQDFGYDEEFEKKESPFVVLKGLKS